MPRITRLSKQKRHNRVNVFLDGQFAFGLPLETVVRQKLKIGRELTPEGVSRLIRLNLDDKLLGQSLRFLSYRPRTVKEVRRYLRQKGAGEEEIEGIISKLTKYQLIDDSAFVAWWLDQRAAFRPKGRRALLAELRQKGVPREMAEASLATLDELAAAKQILAKELAKVPKLTKDPKASFALRQKLTAKLARRGFSWDTIEKALDELLKKV